MELYIKKAKRSIADKFSITDDKGKDLFMAKGDVIGGNKLHVYDASKAEVIRIHEKKIALRKKYEIEYLKEKKTTEVLRREGLANKTEFEIKGLGWEAKGDFDKDNYKITKGLKTIADINPRRLAFGDNVRVEVKDPKDIELALAMVLVCQLETDDNK